MPILAASAASARPLRTGSGVPFDSRSLAHPAPTTASARLSSPSFTTPSSRVPPGTTYSMRKLTRLPMTFLRRNSRAPKANGSSGVSRRPMRGTSSPARQTILVGGGPVAQLLRGKHCSRRQLKQAAQGRRGLGGAGRRTSP